MLFWILFSGNPTPNVAKGGEGVVEAKDQKGNSPCSDGPSPKANRTVSIGVCY